MSAFGAMHSQQCMPEKKVTLTVAELMVPAVTSQLSD